MLSERFSRFVKKSFIKTNMEQSQNERVEKATKKIN